MPHYCQVSDTEVQVPHIFHLDCQVGKGITSQWVKIPASYLEFSEITPAGMLRSLISALQEQNCRLPLCPCWHVILGRVCGANFLCGNRLEQSSYGLKAVLLVYPFLPPLARENKLLLELFLSVLLGISRLLASSSTSGTLRQRENTENSLLCQSLGTEVPSCSASSSPPFSVFCLFYM